MIVANRVCICLLQNLLQIYLDALNVGIKRMFICEVMEVAEQQNSLHCRHRGSSKACVDGVQATGRWEATPVLCLVLRQVDVEPKREAACFVGQRGVHKSEGDIAHVEQVGTVWLLVHKALRFGERVLDIVNLNI